MTPKLGCPPEVSVLIRTYQHNNHKKSNLNRQIQNRIFRHFQKYRTQCSLTTTTVAKQTIKRNKLLVVNFTGEKITKYIILVNTPPRRLYQFINFQVYRILVKRLLYKTTTLLFTHYFH